MGTAAVWVPLAISALGAGVSAYDQQRVAKRQEEVAQKGSMQQQRRQREADARLNQELDTLSGSNAEAERQTALDGFLQQLRANSAAAGGSEGVPTGSDRFKADTTAAGAAIKNFGGTRADNLSRIAAPGLQRRREGYGISRATSDVEGIARNANAEAFLNQLRLNSIRANPWVQAAGQVLQGVGSGMARSGWSGFGPSTVSGSATKFANVMDTPVKLPVENVRAFA